MFTEVKVVVLLHGRKLLIYLQITYNDDMGEPTVEMQELAQSLLFWEQRQEPDSVNGANAAKRVIEKLQALLTRFSGADSFSALMRRALFLSRKSNPDLKDFKLSSDGSISSFKELPDETILTLIAQLLHLMTLFIGKALTLSLLKEAWPEDK